MRDGLTVAPAHSPTGPSNNGLVAYSAGAHQGRQLIVQEPDGQESLTSWLARHDETFEEQISTAGAVLFRHFPPVTLGEFEHVARRACGDLCAENPEHIPVSPGSSVQTPVAYAADRLLLWHNENSFNDEWPARIAFCCLWPADVGGETPIVDSCLVYREIDPVIRAQFIEKGVAYIRHFGSGIGLGWRTIFRTEDRIAIEQYCRAHRLATEWKAHELVRTTAIRPAAATHPLTGECAWFNQAQHWHPSCLDADVRETLERTLGSANLPRHCTFGDGTPIPDEYMHHVLGVYRRHQVVFTWQRGDVLVLDNLRWAHGRNPYRGRRTILVALGQARRDAGERRS